MPRRMNILQEFWLFLGTHKAYWLVPIIVVLLLLVGLVVLASAGGGAAAPFIYTLF
jgi:hypothetical protein